MHFSCEKELIVKEIAVAQEIISSRNTLSILSNVLLENRDNLLAIKATDLKVSFQTQIAVETKSSGTVTVFCDKFLGILQPAGGGSGGGAAVRRHAQHPPGVPEDRLQAQIHPLG
jgi:DNA polymerase-3 subunit beta